MRPRHAEPTATKTTATESTATKPTATKPTAIKPATKGMRDSHFVLLYRLQRLPECDRRVGI